MKLLYIEPSKPTCSFREAVLDANLFNALADVPTIVGDWLADYNEYRPHETLGNVPPTRFMPRVFRTHPLSERV